MGAYGIAISSSDAVYVTDAVAGRVQRFDTDGAFISAWDGFSSGPTGIAVGPTGTVYVRDGGVVRLFNPAGGYLGQFPAGGEHLAISPLGNFLYTAGTKFVVQYALDGSFVRSWITVESDLTDNNGVAVGPSGNVYVVESTGHHLLKYTDEGVLIGEWGAFGSEDGQFVLPSGIAVDADENVYVVDYSNHCVQKFTGDGAFLSTWGSGGAEEGQFAGAIGAAVDSEGKIYVVDNILNRVQKFGYLPTPVWTTTWGRIKVLYSGGSRSEH